MPDFTKDIHNYPFLRFLFPLMGGILFALCLPPYFTSGLRLLALSGALLVILLLAGIRFNVYRYRTWFGVIVHLFFIILGVFLVRFHEENNEKFKQFEGNGPLVGTILSKPEERSKTYKVLINTEYLKTGERWVPVQFKSLVYFEKKSEVLHLKPGDRLILMSDLQSLRSSGNPGEFNYSRYLSDRNIFGRIYIKRGQWADLPPMESSSLIVLSAKLRYKAFQAFQKSGLNDDALRILSALLLGEREYLRDELKDAFADAGVTHIMAVSGLHVGIIYMILFYLLFFLDKIKYGKALKSLVIILVLWSYAFIAGLGPSVVRAVIMFSFISIGQGMKRDVNIFNSLAVAAFFLLCLNPFSVRDVGFQLSFLAVLGIVLLYPKIYPLFVSRYWVIDKAWMLISVSIAAQLATFPLILFYFRQFPNYFLFSNLIAIPLVTIILYAGLFLLAFSFLPFFSQILSNFLNATVSGLVFSVEKISHLPHAISGNIYVDTAGVLLLYIFISFFIGFIYLKRGWILNMALGFMLLFLGWNLTGVFQANKQRNISVLNVSGKSLIQFTHGRTAWLFYRHEAEDNLESIKYVADTYKHFLRLNKLVWINQADTAQSVFEDRLLLRNGFFQFDDQTGFILSELSEKPGGIELENQLDLLIISGKDKIYLEKYLEVLNPETVVIDSSVPFYLLKYLQNDCETSKISCISVKEKGAFIHKMRKNRVE